MKREVVCKMYVNIQSVTLHVCGKYNGYRFGALKREKSSYKYICTVHLCSRVVTYFMLGFYVTVI